MSTSMRGPIVARMVRLRPIAALGATGFCRSMVPASGLEVLQQSSRPLKLLARSARWHDAGDRRGNRGWPALELAGSRRPRSVVTVPGPWDCGFRPRGPRHPTQLGHLRAFIVRGCDQQVERSIWPAADASPDPHPQPGLAPAAVASAPFSPAGAITASGCSGRCRPAGRRGAQLLVVCTSDQCEAHVRPPIVSSNLAVAVVLTSCNAFERWHRGGFDFLSQGVGKRLDGFVIVVLGFTWRRTAGRRAPRRPGSPPDWVDGVMERVIRPALGPYPVGCDGGRPMLRGRLPSDDAVEADSRAGAS